MDVSTLLGQGRALVEQVAKDPAKYEAALASGLAAAQKVQELLGSLKRGDVVAAQATLSSWADVQATRQAALDVEAQNEADTHAITLAEVADGIGATIKVAIMIGKAIA